MKTIRLFGELGKLFEPVIRLNVMTGAEAIRALCANFPGFESYLVNAETKGLGFKVITGSVELEKPDDVSNPIDHEFRIVPVVMGASAEGRILLGAALIAASFFVPVVPLIGSATLASVAFGVGVSLALGGVAQLLSPVPKAGDVPERPDNMPSYNFAGPVNTTLQGQPVPVAYGEIVCGSAIISAGVSISNIRGGTKIVRTESTVDIDAYIFEDSYATPPPANYYKRELLGIDYNPVFNTATYHYRFYYYIETEVAI